MATVVAPAAPPKQKRRLRGPKWGLALPAWFWYVFFFIIPVAFIVAYSFGVREGGEVSLSNPTLENYRTVLDTSGPLYETFRQTLGVAVIGTVLCLLIGFPFAYWMAVKVSPKWRGVALGLVIVPFWTSFLIRTVAWRIVLAPRGLISEWLQTANVLSGPLAVLDTRQAVQIGVVYNYLPLMVFPLFVALDRLDPALREASKDLGASRWKTFRQVTLPLSAPGVTAGLLLVFIPLAGDYITASVLGGAAGNMVGSLVASQFQAAQNQPLGSAMAVVLIAMIMLTIALIAAVGFVVRALIRKSRNVQIDDGLGARPVGGGVTDAPAIAAPTIEVAQQSVAPRRSRRFDFLTFGLGLWAVVVYVFLFLPIVFVVAHSFNSGRAFLVWESFSTEPYSDLWTNEALKKALTNSFKIAIGSTIIATVIGGFAGVALARRGGAWAKPFLLIVFLILVTPEIVDAIGYLIWFVRLGGPLNPQNEWFVPAGLLRLWIGHSVFSSAVVTLIVRARLAGLDESLEEAAADLGATPSRAFRQITLPLMAPGLLAGALLAFTFSLDNTIVSAFVSVAGSTPFPVYVFGAVRAVLRPDIGAAATLMLVLTLFALGVVAFVLRRSGETSSDVAATLTGG